MMAKLTKYACTETSVRKEWTRDVHVLTTHDNDLRWAVVAIENAPHGYLVMRARHDGERGYTENGTSPIVGVASLDAARAEAASWGYKLLDAAQ